MTIFLNLLANVLLFSYRYAMKHHFDTVAVPDTIIIFFSDLMKSTKILEAVFQRLKIN